MNPLIIAIILAFVAEAETSAEAKPAQVIIIRHAEKPDHGETLSTKGLERAAALAPYFMNTPAVLEFGTPVALYATNVTPNDKSLRTQETLTPLAQALGQTVKHPYTKDQYKELVAEIFTTPEYEGKSVLIAWEHHNIPKLAKELGVEPEPSHWHGSDYDSVWVITYTKDGHVKFYTFSQELMYGDARNH